MKYLKEYTDVDEYISDVSENPAGYPTLCRLKTEDTAKWGKKIFYRKVMTDASNPEAMQIARDAGWVGPTDTFMTFDQAFAIDDTTFNAANICIADNSGANGYVSVSFGNLRRFDEFQYFLNVTRTTFTSVTYEEQSGYQGGFFCAYNLEHIKFPPAFMIIGNYCFRSCTKLKEITFPSTLKQISKQAFAYCNKLEDIHWNNGLNVIQDSAFAGSGIGYPEPPGIPTGVCTLPETLTYIGLQAFVNVYDTYPGKFQEVLNLPRIMLMREEIFINQYAPRVVNFGDRLQTLGNGPDYTGTYNDIFWDELETVTVDENNPNFKVINNIVYSKDGTICYGGAEYGLSTQNVVKIEEGCTKIMAGSFRGFMSKSDNGAMQQVCPWYVIANEVCKYIVFPSTLTYIGDRSGQYSKNGVSVVFLGTTPPTVGGTGVWYQVSAFYVPAEAVATYKAATYWKSYTAKIYAITDAILAAIS